MTGASMSQNHHTATAPAEAQSRLCCDVTAAKSNAWVVGLVLYVHVGGDEYKYS